MERRFLELKSASVQLETRESDRAPLIVGYASVFFDGTPDTEYELYNSGSERWVERILQTAFNDAIQRDDVRVLFNHDANFLLGRTSSKTAGLSVDRRGLRYWAVQPDTQVGRDTVASIKRGDLTGSSFSFMPTEQRWQEVKQDDKSTLVIREIAKVDLFDVGPVTFPAYSATTTGVRSVSGIDDVRQSLETWRASERERISNINSEIAAIQRRALRATVECLS